MKSTGSMLFWVKAAIVVLLCWLCSQYMFQLMMIQGKSMLPTYRPFQLTVINKMQREYSAGDVVAFRCKGLDAVLVKRVAAVPGDTAVIRDGTLYVNGVISPVYSKEHVFSFPGILQDAVTLASGEYLVFGDNISESKDSRYDSVGVVLEDTILGKVLGSGNE